MPEWPTMRQMLDDVKGKRVLDLGSGYGWFCRWAAARHSHNVTAGGGAASIRGIELSDLMVKRAKELDEEWWHTADAVDAIAIAYDIGDLETVTLEANNVDIVYSSLALHYLPTPATKRLFTQIHTALSTQGLFVFSVEHPVLTAPINPKPDFDSAQSSDGAELTYWPLNSYAMEGERITDWLAPGVRKYHRRLETYVGMLLEAGFAIDGLRETWEGWDPEGRDAHAAQRPFFLMVKARKKS